MPATISEAIAGLSAGRENVLETVYPSLSATGPGRLIGQLCDSIPLRIRGIKLSHVLFGPLVAPFALLGYLQMKVTGRRYVVTNRSVKVMSSLGERLLGSASLSEFDSIAIDERPGQRFFHAADVVLLKPNGDELLRFPGVARPDRFRQVIVDARNARLLNDAALRTIQARRPVSA
jgi:hypothetical protein